MKQRINRNTVYFDQPIRYDYAPIMSFIMMLLLALIVVSIAFMYNKRNKATIKVDEEQLEYEQIPYQR